MHELPVGVGASLATECFCYLVAGEVAHALLILCLLSHRNPIKMCNVIVLVSMLTHTNCLERTYQVSVATTSAPLTASLGSVPHQIFSSHLRSFTRSHTAAGAWYAGFGGVATRRLWPSRGYVTNISCNTLAESPTYAIVNGRSLGRVAARPFVVDPGGTAEGSKRCTCSCSVRRSARICVGCHSEDSALSTGTGECFASSFVPNGGMSECGYADIFIIEIPHTSISEWSPTRAKIPWHIPPMTRAVSRGDSLT